MVRIEQETGNNSVESAGADRLRDRVVIAPYVWLGTILLLVVAWLFGFFLQHDFPGGIPGWWQDYFLRIPPRVIQSLISRRVLRHMLIPGLVGWGVAWLIGAGYVQKFYRLGDRTTALSFLVDVVLSILFPTSEGRSPSRLSRRQIAAIVLLFSAVVLGPAVLISIHGLFWPLEPASVRTRQFWVLLITITWFVVMLAGLVWLLLGRLLQPSGGPLSVGLGNLEEMREKHALLRVGGPGAFKVKEGHAVAVTERNGRLLRVLGAGKHNLKAYETVRTIISVQEYEHDKEVDLFTRDGIRATIHLAVVYRVAPDDALLNATVFDTEARDQLVSQRPTPTPKEPHRYGEASVRSVADIASVDGDGKVTKWHQLPFPIVEGQLKKAVAHYRLNELFFPEPGFEVRRQAVHDEVLSNARQILQPLGIELIRIRLGPFEISEPVLQGYLELWRAAWQKREYVEFARRQASVIEELAPGLTDVEIAALRSMVETAQQVRSQNGLKSMRPLLALRLIDALERLASQTRGLAASDSAELMEQLRWLRSRLDEEEASGRKGGAG